MVFFYLENIKQEKYIAKKKSKNKIKLMKEISRLISFARDGYDFVYSIKIKNYYLPKIFIHQKSIYKYRGKKQLKQLKNKEKIH